MENNYILVVDDEARMRKLIKDFLVAKGYSILEAGDGEEAAQALDVPDTSPPFVNFCVFHFNNRHIWKHTRLIYKPISKASE